MEAAKETAEGCDSPPTMYQPRKVGIYGNISATMEPENMAKCPSQKPFWLIC